MKVSLKSDGYTSCQGAHGGRDGALTAIGNGTVALQIGGDEEYKVEAWGFPHGDEGSGAWLGLEAVRLALHWLDGRGAPSPLLESVPWKSDPVTGALLMIRNAVRNEPLAETGSR